MLFREEIKNKENLKSNKEVITENKYFSRNLTVAIFATWFFERFFNLGNIIVAGILQLHVIITNDSKVNFFLDIRATEVGDLVKSHYIYILIIISFYYFIYILFDKNEIVEKLVKNVINTLILSLVIAGILQKVFNFGSLFTYFMYAMISKNINFFRAAIHAFFSPNEFYQFLPLMDISLYYVLIILNNS